MSAIKQHLSKLFQRFSADERITSWHLSLYMGMFFTWQETGMKNPIQASRKRLMELSRIKSIVTYHKCIRQLREYGYIDYLPSYHPVLGSQIYLRLIK
jgi:hypothetical protein